MYSLLLVMRMEKNHKSNEKLYQQQFISSVPFLALLILQGGRHTVQDITVTDSSCELNQSER